MYVDQKIVTIQRLSSLLNKSISHSLLKNIKEGMRMCSFLEQIILNPCDYDRSNTRAP